MEQETFIEAPDELPVIGSNAKDSDTVEQPVEAEVSTTEPEQPAESPKQEDVFEFEGQKLTNAELKEALDARKNRDEWQKKNTQKSQELAEERRRLEADAQAAFLGKKLMERPELLQTVFQPEPQRHLDSELQFLYTQRPADPFSQEYYQWEQRKDQLLIEKSRTDALASAQQTMLARASQEHNKTLELGAWDEYKSKVSFDEFKQMSNWIVENLNAKDGKYPQSAFKLAFRELHEDRLSAEAKINGAKSAAESILKAKPASGDNGTRETDVSQSPEDKEDEELYKRTKARQR